MPWHEGPPAHEMGVCGRLCLLERRTWAKAGIQDTRGHCSTCSPLKVAGLGLPTCTPAARSILREQSATATLGQADLLSGSCSS